MEQQRRLTTSRERRGLAIALTVAGWLGLAFGGYLLAGAVWNDDHACFERDRPQGSGEAHPQLAFFPLGISCEWPMVDGSIVTTPQPDLWLSVIVYGSAVATISGGIAVALGRPSELAETRVFDW